MLCERHRVPGPSCRLGHDANDTGRTAGSAQQCGRRQVHRLFRYAPRCQSASRGALDRSPAHVTLSVLSEGEKVRLMAALILIFAIHGQVIAQTMQCQSIPKASDRLACYDKAAPPVGASKTAVAKGKTAAANSSPDQVQAVDMLAAEN
jgi:hypothetical protein